MTYEFKQGHGIPQGDDQEHTIADFCECGPIPIVDPNLGLWYRHNPFDCRDVVEQAEILRKAESVVLWKQAEALHIPLVVVPFDDASPLYMPKTGQRQ